MTEIDLCRNVEVLQYSYKQIDRKIALVKELMIQNEKENDSPQELATEWGLDKLYFSFGIFDAFNSYQEVLRGLDMEKLLLVIEAKKVKQSLNYDITDFNSILCILSKINKRSELIEFLQNWPSRNLQYLNRLKKQLNVELYNSLKKASHKKNKDDIDISRIYSHYKKTLNSIQEISTTVEGISK